ncbi:MAG: hypothetical protein FWD39_02155 [Clostridiales bacterium]|nr:hypothetical protein [Clostridiales bacterium]
MTGAMQMALTVVTSVIGGGGFVAIVHALANKNRNKSEVTDINVKTAIELEKVAMMRYTDVSKHLEFLDKSLLEARKKMEEYHSYIIVLHDLLKEHNIDLPERSQI